MRAGRMNSRLSVLDSAGNDVGRIWADVRPPLEVGEQKGLREAGQTKVLVRRFAPVQPGFWLSGGDQLMVIDGVADRLSRHQDIHLTCTRLIGSAGTYRRATGEEFPVCVHVSVNTPYIGLSGQLMDYRYRLEIPVIHQPAPWQPGDGIRIAGVDYPLTGVAEDGDDGFVVAFTS